MTLKSYPAELSLAALICTAGAVEGTIVTMIMEWGNASIWAIHMDTKFLAALYGVRNSYSQTLKYTIQLKLFLHLMPYS